MRLSLLLLLAQATAVLAADTVESVNALLKAGKEVAWVIQDTVNPANKNLAVVFTARAKGTKPTSLPIIISSEDVNARLTDAMESDSSDEYVHVMENAVVDLGEKRILGRIRWFVPERAYFSGQSRCDFEVLWAPEAGDRAFGILIYSYRWWNIEVILIETGDSFRQTNIKPLLDTTTQKFLSSGTVDLKGIPLEEFAIYYQPLEALNPGVAPPKTSDPTTLKIAFSAEIPKSDTAPSFEGTLTLRLETGSEGEPRAKVLKIEPTTPQ